MIVDLKPYPAYEGLRCVVVGRDTQSLVCRVSEALLHNSAWEDVAEQGGQPRRRRGTISEGDRGSTPLASNIFIINGLLV